MKYLAILFFLVAVAEVPYFQHKIETERAERSAEVLLLTKQNAMLELQLGDHKALKSIKPEN
jgi:hypothetical protein